MSRIQQIVSGHWSSTSAPTATHHRNYEIAAAEFSEMLDELRTLVEGDLVALEEKLEAAGAPWQLTHLFTFKQLGLLLSHRFTA